MNLSTRKSVCVKHLDLNKCIGHQSGSKNAVLGRGGESNHHPGTIKFRDMVDVWKAQYEIAKSNTEKKAIVCKCLKEFRSTGGRIVGRWNKKYYEATDKKQYAKVIQRLREKKSSGGPVEVFGKSFFPINSETMKELESLHLFANTAPLDESLAGEE